MVVTRLRKGQPEPADNHLVQEYEAVEPDQDEVDDRKEP